MIMNEQIKNLCSRLRLYALPRLLESEAHIAREQSKTYPNFNAPKKNQPFFDVFRLRNC